jgi:hypothetical protein
MIKKIVYLFENQCFGIRWQQFKSKSPIFFRYVHTFLHGKNILSNRDVGLRWDQRLYALVLRMSGTPPMSQETGHVASDYSPIDMMCEVSKQSRTRYD